MNLGMPADVRRRTRRTSATVALAIAAVFPFASAAHAATPANVQNRATEITSGTVANLPFAQPNSAGNLIVAYVVWDNCVAGDAQRFRGQQLRQRRARREMEQRRLELTGLLRQNVTGGANTVPAAFGAITSFADLYVHEYSGRRTQQPPRRPRRRSARPAR